MARPGGEFISDFDWTFSAGIEDGPTEEEIRKAAIAKTKIKLRLVVTHGDANPDDENYQYDYGWLEAVGIEVMDVPEFGEGSITFTGIMIGCPVSSGAWYEGNYDNSFFKAHYYPAYKTGGVEISIND